MGLKKYENYSPLELSKGTMQRLNNACAMIQELEKSIWRKLTERKSQKFYLKGSKYVSVAFETEIQICS